MRRSPSREAKGRNPAKLLIGTWSPEFSVFSITRLGSPISTGLPAANDPWALPFRLSQGMVVTELLTWSGSAGGGNVDLGIYTSAWARLVSAGSTAASASNAIQVINVTDTDLSPGVLYYLVLARDNATANRQRSWGGSLTVSQNTLAGVFDSATDAFPLPNPLTNMALAATITQIPVMGMAGRAIF